jgi:peroxiredoxin
MEIPELNKLVEKYKGKDVVFLGIANNDKAKIEKFLEKQAYDYKIVPDGMDVATKYGVVSYPTHIIIDKNFNVIYSTSGLGPTTIDDLDKLIGALVK